MASLPKGHGFVVTLPVVFVFGDALESAAGVGDLGVEVLEENFSDGHSHSFELGVKDIRSGLLRKLDKCEMLGLSTAQRTMRLSLLRSRCRCFQVGVDRPIFLEAGDVEAAVDEGDFAGDAAGEIAGEEEGGVADL